MNRNKKLKFVFISAILVSVTTVGCQKKNEEIESQYELVTVEPTQAQEQEENEVIVLYTNDVHCAVDVDEENGVLGYSKVAGLKKKLEDEGKTVLLVDSGDSIQGDAIGTLSKGKYLIEIMNKVGYDVAIPGNHEFDYGMDNFLSLTKEAEYPYVSCNFMNLETDEAVFPTYKMIEANGEKIAFIGICTPKTLTSSNPKNFQNDSGEYIYGFCQNEDGSLLYEIVQEAVDDAKEEGADYIIALSHLGIEAEVSPWMSNDVIENTTGIDVVLDGHSHSTIEEEKVKNAAGDEVILTSTGTKLAAIGELTIKSDGELTTKLVKENIPEDEEVASYVADIEKQYEDVLNEVIAKSEVNLVVNDPETLASETKVRIVRNTETNLGDFCADAYRAVTGADIALVNAGGIRADVLEGDVTYGNLISVHPYANSICMVEATGQQILDALEIGASAWPEESGGFLQVSGLTYEIHTSIEPSVTTDAEGMFTGVTGEYRVQNVMVAGEALNLEKTYTVTSNNYILKSGGDGKNMFIQDPLILDGVMLDSEALIQYAKDNLSGVVGQEYSNPYGDGRIVEIE